MNLLMEKRQLMEMILKQSNLLNEQLNTFYKQNFGPFSEMNVSIPLPDDQKSETILMKNSPEMHSLIYTSSLPVMPQNPFSIPLQIPQVTQQFYTQTNQYNSFQIAPFPNLIFPLTTSLPPAQYGQNIDNIQEEHQISKCTSLDKKLVSNRGQEASVIAKDSEKCEIETSRKATKETIEEELKMPDDSKFATGATYKCRNVFKSIIRHMYSFSKRSRNSLTQLLSKEGYLKAEIEQAYVKLNYYNDTERHNGIKKQSKQIIREMVEKRSIYTDILRITLEDMISKWTDGKLGRVAENNIKIYEEICTAYYKEAKNLCEIKEKSKKRIML